MFDVKAALQAVKDAGNVLPNMTEATQGGGDYEPPVAGKARLRLIGYIETGKRTGEYQGQPKEEWGVRLIFELSGPKHAPKEIDGVKYPHRLTAFAKGARKYGALNEKSNLFKLFTRMNWKGTATHMAELLGESFLGEVKHREKDGKTVAYLDLTTVGKPAVHVEDADTGDLVEKIIEAGPVLSPLRLFLWNSPSKEMWASLYIDGMYDEKRSKNVLQEAIMGAENWQGSPMHQLLSMEALNSVVGDDASADNDPPFDVDTPDDDPLNGVV